MARPPRPDPIDGWHHVMNRGVDKMAIFHSDDDRLEFGRLLERYCEQHRIEIHAYCLMTNHFHLLVHCPDGNVSAFMHDLTGEYAKRFNAKYGRTGHVFGDRFTSRLVTTEIYLATCGRYIHRNPLDIIGVDDCSSYRWSSHRTYRGLRPCPGWLHTDKLLGWFASPNAFDRYVESTEAGEHSVESPGPGVLIETVDFVIAEHSALVGRRRVGQRSSILTTLANRPGWDDVRQELDRSSESAWRAATHRAKAHFSESDRSRQLVTRIDQLLNSPVGQFQTAA